MFSSVDLSLTVQNNVNYPVQINVLGNPYNLLDTANATTEYRWDFTSFTFTGENQIIIQYKLNSETSFTTYSGQLGSQTLQAIVDVLNGLNIGYFNLYTESGSTYIGTYNDNYTFGQLSVYDPTSILNPLFYVGIGFDSTAGSTGNEAFALQPDGKLLIGGQFTSYQGQLARRIIRLNTDGTIDTTFNSGSGFDGNVQALALQSDGKIVVVGQNFTSYNGTSANNIIRLNTDGSVDATFVYGIGFNNIVNTIEIQSNDKIICGGVFTSYNGTGANRIIRLNTDGSVDATFVYGTGFDSNVFDVAIQNDGKILVCGGFTSYNGTGANRIIRLTTLGAVDGTFVIGTGFDSGVNTMSVQSDGNILCGGFFINYNGTAANRVIRLTTLGAVDTSFVYGTGFNNIVLSISIQSNGFILFGGLFTSYNGTAANRIIRLNTNGSVDTTFDYGTGFNSTLTTIGLNSTNIFCLGSFTTFNGETFNRIVSLNQ